MSEANHYDKLSDFEISERVAKKQGYDIYKSENGTFLLEKGDKPTAHTCMKFRNYCNNWDDIMPIAYEKKIDLVHLTHEGNNECMAATREFHVRSKNPRRAIAITYLKMMESE